MKVRVYRNLHRRTFSVQAKGPKGWRVIGYADRLVLDDARFEVSAAGRARARRTARKNVHGFVVGRLLAVDGATPDVRDVAGQIPSCYQPSVDLREASYSPFIGAEHDAFFRDTIDGGPVGGPLDVVLGFTRGTALYQHVPAGFPLDQDYE